MEQENESKDLILHFEDESEVLKKDFGFFNYNVLRGNTVIIHNGKHYQAYKRDLDVDSYPMVMDLYFELIK